MDMSLRKLWELVMDREAWCRKELDMIEQLNWTDENARCQCDLYYIKESGKKKRVSHDWAELNSPKLELKN